MFSLRFYFQECFLFSGVSGFDYAVALLVLWPAVA
jgi:hypothetical protein